MTTFLADMLDKMRKDGLIVLFKTKKFGIMARFHKPKEHENQY